jgi:hypothetical protein
MSMSTLERGRQAAADVTMSRYRHRRSHRAPATALPPSRCAVANVALTLPPPPHRHQATSRCLAAALPPPPRRRQAAADVHFRAAPTAAAAGKGLTFYFEEFLIHDSRGHDLKNNYRICWAFAISRSMSFCICFKCVVATIRTYTNPGPHLKGTDNHIKKADGPSCDTTREEIAIKNPRPRENTSSLSALRACLFSR